LPNFLSINGAVINAPANNTMIIGMMSVFSSPSPMNNTVSEAAAV
jgi:hypothetical protein